MLNIRGLRDLAVRFQKFLLIGTMGFSINIGLLYLLKEAFHIHYVLAAFAAIETSLFATFILNETWTWRDRRGGRIGGRFLKYQVVNGIGLGINILVLFLLTNYFGIYYVVSNTLGAGMAAFWNFGANHLFTWRLKGIPPS